MEYYTYAYLREDGTPYYIGKGKAGRITNSLHRIAIPKNEESILCVECPGEEFSFGRLINKA